MNNFEPRLKQRTLELFAALPRHVRNAQIAKATGLSPSWITDFTKGNIADPSVDRVEILYNYLNNAPLKV